MYHQLAHLYDWPGAEDFARVMLEIIGPELEKAGLDKGARILDLACGTGTISLALARQGFDVTGLDLSRPMLGIAEEKAQEAGLTIDWVQGDMRQFLLSPPFDAVLCLYDSLNHLLSEQDLKEAFESVKQNLAPGGLFLFDVNTRVNYDTFWQGKDVYEGPNYRLTTETRFTPETGRAHVRYVAEEHTEDGLLVLEEDVHEQYFDEMCVEDLLKQSGFRNIELESFNPFADDDLPTHVPLKTFWHCIR